MKKIFYLSLTLLLLGSQLVFAQTEKKDVTQKDVTLRDIWTTRSLFPKTIHGIVSLNNGKQYTEIKNGSIVVYDYRTGDSVTTLVNDKELVPEGKKTPIHIGNFSVNKDGTEFIFPTQTKHIYRHSRISYDYIWDTKTKKLTSLSDNGKQRIFRRMETGWLSLGTTIYF